MDEIKNIKTMLRVAGRANALIADLRKLKKQAEECGEPTESYDEAIIEARNARKTVEEWQAEMRPTEWNVIFSRYMIGNAWKVIEREMHLSHSRVMAIHLSALHKIEGRTKQDKTGQNRTKQDLQQNEKSCKVKSKGKT